MTRTEGLRSVGLTFDWAASHPRPKVGTEPVVLDQSAAALLSKVRERLIRREEPPHHETLVGHVRSLVRDDGDEDEAGTITLTADVRGQVRNVRMTLTSTAHEWAIIAYRSKVPLVVSGDLVFERRTWQLKNPQVDSSFLEHLQQSPPQ